MKNLFFLLNTIMYTAVNLLISAKSNISQKISALRNIKPFWRCVFAFLKTSWLYWDKSFLVNARNPKEKYAYWKFFVTPLPILVIYQTFHRRYWYKLSNDDRTVESLKGAAMCPILCTKIIPKHCV